MAEESAPLGADFEALQPGHFSGFLFPLPVCIRNVFLTTKSASRSCCAMSSPPWDYTHSGTVSQNRPRLPQLAFCQGALSQHRKVINTSSSIHSVYIQFCGLLWSLTLVFSPYLRGLCAKIPRECKKPQTVLNMQIYYTFLN